MKLYGNLLDFAVYKNLEAFFAGINNYPHFTATTPPQS